MNSWMLWLLLLVVCCQLEHGVPQRHLIRRRWETFRAGKSDTGSGQEADLSVLCPTLAKHLLPYFRYDIINEKCFRAGTRGPCGNNMLFFADPNSRLHGSCDCDYENQDRELIYEATSNQCHFVFSQGYCMDTSWLSFDDLNLPICASNPCFDLQSTNRSTEFVVFNNACRMLGSECGDGKVIDFVSGQLEAICTVPRRAGFTIGVPKLRCLRGSIRNIAGRCRPKLSFDRNG